MAKLKSEYGIQCVSLLREKEGQKEREIEREGPVVTHPVLGVIL